MFNNESGFTMPVVPASGSNGGFLGGDGIWAILLFALIFGGFGGGFGMGGWGMMGMGMMDGFGLYPWLNNSQNINGGFRDQMMNDSLNSIKDGISGLSTQLCGLGGDFQLAMANAESAANARQMANMQTAFAGQTAMNQGFNAVQGQLAQASSDNRLGVADLKYTVAAENCADRAASAQNTQSIITAITAGIQSIKDDLCADRLDAERRENQNLRTQLSMAQIAASQVEQTAQLRASQATTANQLVSELRSCPIPSQPVYGNQPIFTCGQNNYCGCIG